MKTLDEVIEAERHCIGIGCRGCPYDIVTYGGSCECNEDVLHYLEEYRDSKATIADAIERYTQAVLRHMNEADKLATQRFVMEYDNPPLTWDELKGMEGKPVWVEYNLHLSDKDARSRMWIIIQQIFPWKKDNELIYYSGFVFGKDEIGKAWQAYRMERKSDTSRSN